MKSKEIFELLDIDTKFATRLKISKRVRTQINIWIEIFIRYTDKYDDLVKHLFIDEGYGFRKCYEFEMSDKDIVNKDSGISPSLAAYLIHEHHTNGEDSFNDDVVIKYHLEISEFVNKNLENVGQIPERLFKHCGESIAWGEIIGFELEDFVLLNKRDISMLSKYQNVLFINSNDNLLYDPVDGKTFIKLLKNGLQLKRETIINLFSGENSLYFDDYNVKEIIKEIFVHSNLEDISIYEEYEPYVLLKSLYEVQKFLRNDIDDDATTLLMML